MEAEEERVEGGYTMGGKSNNEEETENEKEGKK